MNCAKYENRFPWTTSYTLLSFQGDAQPSYVRICSQQSGTLFQQRTLLVDKFASDCQNNKISGCTEFSLPSIKLGHVALMASPSTIPLQVTAHPLRRDKSSRNIPNKLLHTVLGLASMRDLLAYKILCFMSATKVTPINALLKLNR